jgi:dolichol-phosphate mannosyltransferase
MRVFVMVPTYNERENVPDLVRGIHGALPGATVLVVDDSSPDGTAGVVRRLMRRDRRLRLLLRPREVKGRGWAGRDGFLEALRLGADVVAEMDADLSHDPRRLPALLAPLKKGEADIVLGSRFVAGGRDADRPWYRRAVSRFARQYLSLVLGLRAKDPSSGYRVFTRAALLSLGVAGLRARDPFIVTEMLYRATRAGLRIVESPIVFVDRTRGTSKLGFATLLKYLGRALWLRLSPGAGR